MLNLLLVDTIKEEGDRIEKTAHDAAAKLTEENWNFNHFSKLPECENYLKSKPELQFCCFDTDADPKLDVTVGIRKEYEQMMLMLIADSMVSPCKYLKPGIRPDLLLLRPFKDPELKDSMEEFISSGMERLRENSREKTFLIENKEGQTHLDFHNIYYFEAREKKVYVRTLQEEYGFYKGLEELQNELPEQFVRCHRSYIINTAKIKRIIAAENLIELTQDFMIPLSRSYKAALKNRMRK